VALVTLYTKAGCHLCEDALAALQQVRSELSFELELCDIALDEALHRKYFERIPVVCLDGEELCEYFVDAALVRERLQAGEAPRTGHTPLGAQAGRRPKIAEPGPSTHPLESRRWPSRN
jgi:glutaredoxin